MLFLFTNKPVSMQEVVTRSHDTSMHAMMKYAYLQALNYSFFNTCVKIDIAI